MKQFVFLPLLFLTSIVFAQSKSEKKNSDYPQDYFRNPLGIPIFLAGNFGECRPGHFHSGLDIKTKGEENEAVYAAADGYISRIKMDKGGFGHALYITHANGYTTLYAHLNDFMPPIQKYVKEKQYEKRMWDVDLTLLPTEFPVKKGEQIAWSGNTGSSTAPHLHFEIRNTKNEHPLNPELFGLPIIDHLPPVPAEIVFYTGNIYEDAKITATLLKKDSIYVPAIQDNAGKYIPKDTFIINAGVIGIGINADDFMDSSTNTLAFYKTNLFKDDSLQATVILDNIGYEETRYINSYTDYKTKELEHKWVQCLFQTPGNRLSKLFSDLNTNKGRIQITENRCYTIRIELIDDKENKSNIIFVAKAAPALPALTEMSAELVKFKVNTKNEFNNPSISFVLDEKQLYDDINFRFKVNQYDEGLSDKYDLHYPYIPIHHNFELKMRAKVPFPFELRRKVAMLYSNGKEIEGKRAEFTEMGWYVAKQRNFGTYWLALDTLAPTIKLIQNTTNFSKAKEITFEVKDAMTSVAAFSGTIDGNWICFEQHGNLFFYKFDEHCSKGKHQLLFKAEDECGNTSSYNLNFTR